MDRSSWLLPRNRVGPPFSFSQWLPAIISAMERRREEDPPGQGRPYRLDDLDWKTRQKIFTKLGKRDRKSLRVVCKLFRAEVDNIMGVHAYYVGTEENHKFLSTVDNLQSLTVTYMFDFFIPEFGFFKNNYLLQRLVIQQGVFTRVNVMNLLSIFTGLKEFKLLPPKSFLSALEEGIMTARYHYLTANDLIDLLILASRNAKLETYYLFLQPVTDETRSFREYNDDPNWMDYPWLYSTNGALQHMQIHAPELDEGNALSWLEYWDCESKLRTIELNVGPINGNQFGYMIHACRNTLTSVKLANMLMSHNNTSIVHRWEMFYDCVNLRVLSLSAVRNGTDSSRYLFSAGIHDFNFEQLTELYLYRVKVTPTVFGKLIVSTSLRMKILELHFFMMELGKRQLQQLDWTLGQGQIEKITLLELTSKMVGARAHFEKLLYNNESDVARTYCFMGSEPYPDSTQLEFDKGLDLNYY